MSQCKESARLCVFFEAVAVDGTILHNLRHDSTRLRLLDRLTFVTQKDAACILLGRDIELPLLLLPDESPEEA